MFNISLDLPDNRNRVRIKSITYTKSGIINDLKCPECDGDGHSLQDNTHAGGGEMIPSLCDFCDGSGKVNENMVEDFGNTLASYAHRLRGFTVYPHNCRGGQPLTPVPYKEALAKGDEEFEDFVEAHDICDITGHGGSCGV